MGRRAKPTMEPNERGGVDLKIVEEEKASVAETGQGAPLDLAEITPEEAAALDISQGEQLAEGHLGPAHMHEVFYSLKMPIPGIPYSNMEASCRVTSQDYAYANDTAMAAALKNFADLHAWVTTYTWEQIREMFMGQEGQDVQEQEQA
jgi:hypothetical protein